MKGHTRLAAPWLLAAALTACQAKAASPEPGLAAGVAATAAVAAPAAPSNTPMVTLPDFSTVAAKVLPSVVSIKVAQRVRNSAERGQPGMPNDFFHFFQMLPPGFRMPRPGPEQALGSGFVIDSSGLILTNYHVIENADEIQVTLQTTQGAPRVLSAKVIGKAPDYDVALIKTDENANAPALALGDSDAARIGQWVMAVGNPFGLSQTVSVGIISAKDRNGIAPEGREGLYDFMQTDAAINPGNSGGPLVDMAGNVIGMNSAINAQGSGIGFAIPSNIIHTMLGDLKTKGSFSRAWIGVKIQQVTQDLAQSYGLKEARGALVAEVVPDGPAAKAGLKDGDVILSFDGRPVLTSDQLPVWAGMAGPGKTAKLGVWRDGHERTIDLKLGTYPGNGETVASAGGDRSNKLGLALEDLTPNARSELGLGAHERGAVVTDVDGDSPAARAGLREGDVIVSMQGEQVTGAESAARILSHVKSGQAVRLQILRGGSKLFVAMRKP